MTCCCKKSNLVCFQAMHCLSASYHCVQLIIALLVPFQTARLSFKSTAMQFQLFLLTCIVSRPPHYLPKLLMSTAYLSIYDGIILSPPRTLPDNRRYLRLWIGFIIRFIACLSSTLNKRPVRSRHWYWQENECKLQKISRHTEMYIHMLC